jgi:hypothetical protein
MELASGNFSDVWNFEVARRLLKKCVHPCSEHNISESDGFCQSVLKVPTQWAH